MTFSAHAWLRAGVARTRAWTAEGCLLSCLRPMRQRVLFDSYVRAMNLFAKPPLTTAGSHA